MVSSYEIKSLEPTKYSDKKIVVEQVTECPICKSSIRPLHLHSVFYVENNIVFIESHEFCTNCNHSFVCSRRAPLSPSGSFSHAATIKCVEPQKFKQIEFDDSLKVLSPQFVKIYNQALAAETSGLDEIAGLGYRKALEFLVKDFAIHQNPNDCEDIKKLMLSLCIKKYIDNPQIKTLVERSAWIGNDEAHYIRKQADRDVNDMKAFIKATVYFIGMVLITEDAASMEPK